MTVPLPHTFRPLGVRIAVFVFGALLLLVTAVIWFTFPQSIRDQFTIFQRGTVIVLGLGFLSLGWGLARSRVEARDTGLTVVNGYRSRTFEWAQIVAITLRPGSPWAELDLSDGTTVAAIGIQGSDGARAVQHVREIRQLVERHSGNA
ncbi:PH domain-containing protein [Nocardioides mesophilus]|uniref:PH domain-containing protein n=1 Tax=Nocardioides mesophilus TaxID=433659 RepID=A0A7G9RAE9_9ACTN|nr:PH domain-containing protein [Nocardioides mesophilus]